jgi:hypothetical protein
MFPVSIKVGSVVRIPVLAGWMVTSSDPTVLAAAIAGNVMTLTAVKQGGTATLKLQLATDLAVSLVVTAVT